MLAAVAPRVQVRSQVMYRQHGIDAALMTRVCGVIEKELGGGRFATRVALAKALAGGGIEASGVRLGLMMLWAELEQVVCSGPRQGKQFTYALFDERVGTATRLPAEDARAALAARYVASHGPVTIRDFVCGPG